MNGRNFLGIPVEGTIRTIRRVPQRPIEELRPLLEAVLGDERIAEFGWMQYTPYFADGEPCVFDVQSVWARTGDDAGTPVDDLEVGKYAELHPTLGGIRRGGGPKYVGVAEPCYRRVRALADALHSGGFGDVLMDAFGDHASLTVRRTGITVDYYEHE
jgi:hypothetical protein